MSNNLLSEERIISKFKSHKNNTKRRGISCLFNKEDWDIFCKRLNAHPFCAYTGVALNTNYPHPRCASIDRIDCTAPYSLDNCCWTAHEVNLMKNALELGHKVKSKRKAEYEKLFTTLSDSEYMATVRGHAFVSMPNPKETTSEMKSTLAVIAVAFCIIWAIYTWLVPSPASMSFRDPPIDIKHVNEEGQGKWK